MNSRELRAWPAFPRGTPYAGANERGMTLRDYYAGQALVGILSAKFAEMVANVPGSVRYDLAATDAFLIADSMLVVRDRTADGD